LAVDFQLLVFGGEVAGVLVVMVEEVSEIDESSELEDDSLNTL
jgi:hypothetical protein